MPEGPEIRRAADAIADVLEGSLVETVRFGLPRLRHHTSTLRGHRVTQIETRGKALLTHFEHGYSIYSHNQLYGIWQVISGHKLPPSNRSLRLMLQTSDHSALLYSASDISVWRTVDLPKHPFLAKIGPDIMNTELAWRDIASRLIDPRFSGKSLANLYLDQEFLAGNGNYLRSEILHQAGLHPLLRPRDLSRAELGRLARETLAISQRSYKTAGVTLKPRLYGQLTRGGAPWEKRRFYVFGRAGRACHQCGSKVKRTELAGRRLYLCHCCQPKKRV